MKRIFLLFIFPAITLAQNPGKTGIYDEKLAAELKQMEEMDQIAASLPKGKYKEYSNTKWKNFKDSVFTTHQKRLEKIFNRHGYPGYDLVGEKGELHFWVMVQHSDFDPDFQEKVLIELKKEIEKGNASGRHYGLLTDRVRLNTGRKQLYGTQVKYNSKGQATPQSLADSSGVDIRRSEVGLEPLKEYLNLMTGRHFEMNKDYFEGKGITEPLLYK